jgi:DNA modification methylase
MKRKPPGCRAAATSRGHNASQLQPVAISGLKVRPGEPRRYPAADVDRAVNVLRQLPADVPCPVVVNEHHEILIGGIFVEAARKLGQEWLLVIVHAGLTDLEQKQYGIAINQLLSRGEWDPGSLEIWIRELEAGLEDFSHLTVGFSNGELDRVLGLGTAIVGSGAEADAVPAVQPVAVSRLGMVWHAGQHRVMVGDATSREAYDRLMAGLIAKMVITDPPFGCPIDGFVSKKGLHRDFVQGAGEMSREELAAFFLKFMQSLLAHLQKGALAYVFIDWRSLDLLLAAGEQVFGPLIQLCCWVKDRAGMGSFYRSQHELVLVFRAPGDTHVNNVQLGRHGRNRSNVWDYPCAASSRSGREGDMLKHHPTPKTVEMIADAILDCTGHGERVVDCFLGSGTTLIAAERTGRICHGMELDPLYADVAIRRWQTWTGLDALDPESGKAFNQLALDAEQGGNGNVEQEG